MGGRFVRHQEVRTGDEGAGCGGALLFAE
jgi:hypothetical protein